VEDDQLRTRRGELADHPVRRRVEEIGHQDDHAAAVELRCGVPGGCDELRRPDDRLDRRQVREEPEHASRTPERRLAAARPAAERTHRDAVLGREPDVTQRGRGALREQELLRPAGRHRGRDVDEDRDRHVLLFDEELDEELLEPRVHVPVELAEVVPERVIAVVGELDALAALDAAPPALQAAPDRRAQQQQEALELTQEALVEDRRVEVVREERRTSSGLRRRGPRLCHGSEKGWAARLGVTPPPVVRRNRGSSGSRPRS
jgi:hypothetical protein